MLKLVTCPGCSMKHIRTETHSIFCKCGSAAAWDTARRSFVWFRVVRLGRGAPRPETQTEARGCAGAEIDL